MTYNVFSETLNPTQSINLLYRNLVEEGGRKLRRIETELT